MKSYIPYLMLQAKSLARIGALLCGLFFLLPQDAEASHIVGGDLTYECLGGNMYRITLVMRRDCLLGDSLAQFDDPASIALYDLTTNLLITDIVGVLEGQILIPFNHSDTLNEILVSDCSVVMGDVCVHTTKYIITVALPYRPTGYVFAYQRCCRNMSINNIIDPDDTGMTLVAELTGPAQLECNSSPQFGAYPPIYTCVNKPISFDHAAFDLEGDSLVYELCTPLAGGTRSNNRPRPASPPPYDEVVFRAPYSLNNVMGGVPLQIDPQTGLLTGTPNTIGQFVIGICVTAYKNGVQTGRTRRDFQYNVRLCRDVPVADFSVPALDCEDLTITLDNTSLLSDEFEWIFDFGNPNSPTSTEFEPTFTYSGPGFYDVALIVNDSLEFCFDTLVQTIGVFDSQINAAFEYDVSTCTEEEIVLNVTDASSGFDIGFPADTYEWLLTYPGGTIPSSEVNPTFTFTVDGQSTVCIALVVTSTNGCSATQTECFPVQPISILVNPESDSICFGESTQLILGGDTGLTYIWDPLEGLVLDPPSDPTASPEVTTTYCVTVTDGLCEVTDCIPVNVQQLPSLAFDYETDCKTLVVEFNNNTTGGELYMWDFGVPGTNTDTSTASNPTFTFPEPGEYTVTLSSRDGCDVSVSHVVTSNAITETLDDQIVNCFENTIELNPDHNDLYTYEWSPGDLLTDPNDPNPSATITDDTEFFVTISQANLPGCEIVDSITVLVPDLGDVNTGADITSCKLEDILLTASTTGNENLDYVWTVIAGDTVGTGPTLVVQPNETTIYIVTATDTLGCSMSDTISVNRPPPGFEVDAMSDTTYCNIQTINLSATSVSGITFEWFNCDDDLIGEGGNVDVTPGLPTCFYVIGTDPLTGCEASDTVELTPIFFSLNISDDQGICLDESLQLSVTNNDNQHNFTYLWSPIELIDNGAVTQIPTVSPPQTTTYCVQVTNTDLGCADTLCTTVTVNVFEPLQVTITADPPEIILTQSTTLTVNQPPHFTYSWSSSTPGEVVPSVYNPLVTPTQVPTTYTVTVTNEAGCTQVASFTLPIVDPLCDESEIFIPTAFTPNNDGINDVLFVRSNFISTMELHIYNRWGQEVFSTNTQSVGWDGTFKGKRLPPDVFGYYMEIGCPNGKEFFKKGNITILE